MTGRFSRLEFDEGKKRQRQAAETPATGRAEEALELYGTPKRDAAHYLALANDARRIGAHESALQHFTRAVREERTMIVAWVGQVQMLVELREYSEARLWADKALELFRSNGELLAAKAQACVRVGDRPTAQACSDAALKAPGSSPWRWAVRGEVLLARGEAMARTCFQRAISEPAADWFERTLIASIHLFHGKAAAAVEFAQAGVSAQPSAPYAWLVLGQCQRELGWSEQAHLTFQRALELTPRLEAAAHAMAALERESHASGLLRRLRHWFRR